MGNFVFILIAAITIASAIWVVSSSNLIYSAVALLFTLFGVAGLYVFLYADFLAAVQVLIYVGGILVLIIFGVMLTNKIDKDELKESGRGKWKGALISLSIFTGLFYVISKTEWITNGSDEVSEGTVEQIGQLILGDYLLPFEVISLLLLASLIGAAYLSRKQK
jgi:NADH-quinone oxidoreductase subunit J